MQIFGIIINKASKVRKAMEKRHGDYLSENEWVDFNILLGIYSSRIFGVCIYRPDYKIRRDYRRITRAWEKIEKD